ncbi:MAG: hypothetical protein SangKO_030530 [Sandaracinaceae bacterium]
MNLRLTIMTAACLFAATFFTSSPLSAELRRRHHAQHCFPETDFVDDYFIWGHNGRYTSFFVGMITNDSDLIGARERDLWCPMIDDSTMAHHTLDTVVVHGVDEDQATEVAAQACVSRFASSLFLDCGAISGSGLAATGPFGLSLDISPLSNPAYEAYRGYPFLVVTLPKGQKGSRVAGYETCANDPFGSC